MANPLPGVTEPFTGSHTVGEVRHPVEYALNITDYVSTIHEEGFPHPGTEGRVQDGSVFRHVDVLPAEHRLDPLRDTCTTGDADQRRKYLIGDQVLGEVDHQIAGAEGQALCPARVYYERPSQIEITQSSLELLEFLPLLCRVDWYQTIPPDPPSSCNPTRQVTVRAVIE